MKNKHSINLSIWINFKEFVCPVYFFHFYSLLYLLVSYLFPFPLSLHPFSIPYILSYTMRHFIRQIKKWANGCKSNNGCSSVDAGQKDWSNKLSIFQFVETWLWKKIGKVCVLSTETDVYFRMLNILMCVSSMSLFLRTILLLLLLILESLIRYNISLGDFLWFHQSMSSPLTTVSCFNLITYY